MKKNNWLDKLKTFLQSGKCFYVILGIFLLESCWIAFSASYPMVFDEDFHFGIIKLYSHQLSPFFTSQPAGGDAFGALSTDPSYLYHYLMSFPYRLISLITKEQSVQIIALRLIDVALVASSLILFRLILLKVKVSGALTNVTLLFFILVPVLPLLAGQINYDDLLLPLTTLAILLAMEIKEHIVTGDLSITRLMTLLVICLFASLVQIEFLPIFVAIVVYLGYKMLRSHQSVKEVTKQLSKSLKHSSRWVVYGTLVLFIVALGLFTQRYGTNLAVYHSPDPQCDQVLTIGQCSAYAPWLRNYTDEQHKPSVEVSPLSYAIHWVYGMFIHSFFTSSGGGNANALYINIAPMPVISIVAIVIFGWGTLLFFRYARKIIAQYPALSFLLIVTIVYCFILWVWDYQNYVKLGSAVALNGRYLFPVAPFFMVAIGLAYTQWLRQRTLALKQALLFVTLILFLQGGGISTFIIANNTYWLWSNSFSTGINGGAQKVIRHLIIS